MRLLSLMPLCGLLVVGLVPLPAQDAATPSLQEWQRRQDEAALANIRAQRDVMYRAAPQPAAVNTGIRPVTPVLSLTATPTLSEPLRLYYVPDFTEQQKKESDEARGFWANVRGGGKTKPAPAGETEGATVMPLKDGEAVAEVAQAEGSAIVETPESEKTEENGFFARRFGRNSHNSHTPPADPASAPVEGDAGKPAEGETSTPPAEGDPTELADATVTSKPQRKTLGSLFRKNSQPAAERTEVASIGNGLEEKKTEEQKEENKRFLAAFRKPKAEPTPGEEAASPEEETVDAKTEKNETTDQYMAINQMRAPFHVFDEEPGETFIIELSQNTVGRVQANGEEWAWLQLDSGLMGVMKNKSLRPAKKSEVLAFLAVESGDSSTPFSKPPVQYVDVNLPELPSMAQAQTEMPLGHGLLPPVAPEDTTTLAGETEPKMTPLFQSKGFEGDELSIGSATMSADDVAASVARNLEAAAAAPIETAVPKAEGETKPAETAPASEPAPPAPAAPGEMKASDIAAPSTIGAPAANSPARTGQLSFDQLQMLLPPSEPKNAEPAPAAPSKPEAAPAPAPEAPKAKETEEVEMIEVTVEETEKPAAGEEKPAPAPAAGS